VHHALLGTIFAYGQTGSGKTFTITGGPEKYEVPVKSAKKPCVSAKEPYISRALFVDEDIGIFV